MGIQKYKKQKIPDRSDQQKEVNRAKCATLYRRYTEIENGFWTMRVILQKLIPLSMEMTISTRTK